MGKNTRITILVLSLLISGLIILVSLTGILDPELYSRESLNWRTQSIAQDKVDLFLLVPVLLITSILIYLKKTQNVLIWAGVILYLIYTFTIYCFAVHFNQLYPIYCLILGLSFYTFVYFLFRRSSNQTLTWQLRHQPNDHDYKFGRWPKVIGIYFVLIALLFYVLWLSEILPAVFNGAIPSSLAETGLPINPVHSIDLALFLPGLFLVGLFFLRKKPFALMMGQVILTFFILMNLTIGILALDLEKQGLGSGQMLAIIMLALAILSGFFLVVLLRKTKLG